VDDSHYRRLPPFVIDPLFVARHKDLPGNPSGSEKFPYFVDTTGVPPAPLALQNLQLPRVTLASMVPTAGRWTETADRVFTCHDDITFFHSQRDDRGDIGPGGPVIQGDYSYLVMVTPAESENPYPSQSTGSPPYYAKKVALDQRRLFTVQVVVFHKRDLGAQRDMGTDPTTSMATPAERQIYANPVSSNSAELHPSNPAYVSGLAPNQWIMLSVHLPEPSDEKGPPGTYPPVPPNPPKWPIHRWVRIVSVSKETNPAGGMTVRVNFAGPDWPGDRSVTPPQARAAVTIVDTVVAVHERTVELDARSLTAP
jgi:hypothetical protein